MSSGDGGFNRLRKHYSKRPRTQTRSSLASQSRPTGRPLTQLLVRWATTLSVMRSARRQGVYQEPSPLLHGQCGTAVPWVHREPAARAWSLLECAAPGRSSHCGPAVLRVHREPATRAWSLLECAAPGRSSQCGTAVLRVHREPATRRGPSWSVRLLAAPRSVGPRSPGLVPPQVQQTIAARQHPWRQQYWSSVWWDITGTIVMRTLSSSPMDLLLVFITNGTDAVSSFVMPTGDATFDTKYMRIERRTSCCSGARRCGSSCQ